MSHLPPPHCPGTWFYKFSIRWPSWADLRFKPMGDDCLLPPTFPSSHLSLSRKLKTYTPLPASGCPLTVALDSDRTVGQPGLSPVPNPLVPWGCLDQSCKRLTAGGSSIRTRITWRSSVPRSPGGEAEEGLCGWGRPSAALLSFEEFLLSVVLSCVWEKSWRTKPGGKLPSVKCRTSAGAANVSVGDSGDGGSGSGSRILVTCLLLFFLAGSSSGDSFHL